MGQYCHANGLILVKLGGNAYDVMVIESNESGWGLISTGIGPQIVCVIERNGDWMLIETWIGEKRINVNAIRMSAKLDVPLLNQQVLGCLTGYDQCGFFYNDQRMEEHNGKEIWIVAENPCTGGLRYSNRDIRELAA